MRKRWLWFGLFHLLLPAVCWGVPAVVTDVQVQGTLRVEPGLVLQKVRTKPGEPYDPAKVREDIKAVYALGHFKDVVVELDDQGRLVFVVTERPSLREWKTEGAEAIDAEEIGKAVTLKKREIVDDAKVDQSAKAIRDLYREKGYYLAQVGTEVVAVPDGKNQADILFKVSEGEKVRLKDVNLLGVASVEQKEVRKYMAMGPASLWSWLSGSGTFKEGDLERDRDVIRSYYLNHGYAEVKVLEPLTTLTADRKWLKVDIPVVEGLAFTIGSLTFSGDLDFPEAKLRETAGLKTGDTFRSEDFRKATQTLADLYGEIGYAFADIDPLTKLDREARTINVDFRIRKAELIRIGRIEVHGNSKTRDRIVRREMRLAEGELYNGVALRRSRRRIENLGYFEKVNLTTNRRPGTDLVDIDIDVEEKSTGALSVGAGYSSTDRVIGMASVSQRNFLGLGYQLALNANFGSRRETYSVTFNNPRVFDSEVYAGVDVYKTFNVYTDYTKKATGGDLKLGTSLGEDWKIRWTYRLEQAHISDISSTAPAEVLQLERDALVSALRQSVTYDTRDNPWEPHGGSLAELGIELAGGPLGGTTGFTRYDLEGSKYFPLWWRHVLTLHTQLGYIVPINNKEIPVYERFALGGINSIRGFESRSVGAVHDGVVGGKKMALFNVEYLFPLLEEAKLRGVLFFDAGNTWWDEPFFTGGVRTGAGFGVRWFSPMGPLRLEYGFKLDPKEDEGRSRWEFSIGGFF
ncbi:MAG: outer membrane protein assembly factor BamA [Deltaproteobacteria bacterium]|nr:outer membrane protein assembly factor BamA [Deltaproteobacteria bacterium]